MSRKSGSFSEVLLSIADSRRKNGFQPINSLFFCVGQQKKKNRSKRTSKKNRYFGTCKPTICVQAQNELARLPYLCRLLPRGASTVNRQRPSRQSTGPNQMKSETNQNEATHPLCFLFRYNSVSSIEVIFLLYYLYDTKRATTVTNNGE